MVQKGHRGVSAFSFCDGAIPRFSFVPKIKKRVRTEGTENTEEDRARDRTSLKKTCRTKVRRSQAFKRPVRTEGAENTEENWARVRTSLEKNVPD